MILRNCMKLFSPKYYLPICRVLSSWLFIPTCVSLFAMILWISLFGPIDHIQGLAFRWIYLHVPTAFASMALYFILALCQMVHWGLHIRVMSYIADACAFVGLVCSLIAIVSGAAWGHATWGVWWVWDPRLTTELMLMVFYIVFIMVRRAAAQYQVSNVMPVIIAILGFIHLPLIHYSVEWWNSLHQGSTLLNLSKNTLPFSMLWPLMLTFTLSAFLITTIIAKMVLKYHQGSQL